MVTHGFLSPFFDVIFVSCFMFFRVVLFLTGSGWIKYNIYTIQDVFHTHPHMFLDLVMNRSCARLKGL